MAIAPAPVLRAASETVHLALVYCRNHALGDAPPKMVSELMEAIHEVPSILVNWTSFNSVDELRMYFREFGWGRWPDMPNLVADFDDRLKRYGYSDDAA